MAKLTSRIRITFGALALALLLAVAAAAPQPASAQQPVNPTASAVKEQQRATILRLGRDVAMNVGTERVTIHQRSM